MNYLLAERMFSVPSQQGGGLIVLFVLGGIIFHVVVLLTFLHYSRRSAEALEKLARSVDLTLDYLRGRADGAPVAPPRAPVNVAIPPKPRVR